MASACTLSRQDTRQRFMTGVSDTSEQNNPVNRLAQLLPHTFIPIRRQPQKLLVVHGWIQDVDPDNQAAGWWLMCLLINMVERAVPCWVQ